MTAITAPLVLLGRRIRANWRFVAVLFAGVVLATTLLASAPMYLASMKELGLRHALAVERTGVLDTAVAVPLRPLDQSGYERTRQAVERRAEATIGPLVNQRVTFINTTPLDLTLPSTRSTNIKASIQSFSGYEAKSKVVSGAFPRAVGETSGSAVTIEAAIGQDSANALRLNLGDVITMAPSGLGASRAVKARIVGILEPIDLEEQYWTFVVNPFAPQVDSSTGADIPMLPVLVPQDTFFQLLAPVFKGALVNYWWYYLVDPARVDSTRLAETRQGLRSLEQDLTIDLPGSQVFSGLPRTLDNFDQKLFFSRIPILIVLILVVTVVLYYLVMVANVVVDRHLGEIALLRSRGANGLQVMAVYVWEAVIIAVAAGIVGPFLGLALLPLLGKAPAFSIVTRGGFLPVSLSREAFLFSLLGAGLSFLALLLPALRGARFNVLSARAATARPAALTVLHKYYIDLFLLAVAAILYWELTQRGSLVTRKLFGGDSTDWMLLIAPSIFMVAAALVFMRALPIIVRLAGLIASYTGRVWLVMGLWTIGRDPVQYIRPIVLLTLVAGLAMFAASFNLSVQGSFEDRGLYQSGADVRLVGLPAPLSGTSGELSKTFESQPEVTQAAAVFRSEPRDGGAGERSYNLLTMDTIKFRSIPAFRKDFSNTDLFALLRKMDQGRSITRGRDLPEGTTSLGLWLKPSKEMTSVSAWVRVRDGDGGKWRFRLGRLDFNQWRLLRADLASFGQPLKGPLVLEAVYFWEFDFPDQPYPPDLLVQGHMSSGQINMSGLTAFSSSGPPGGTVLDPLSAPDRWAVMATRAISQETLKTSATERRINQPTLEMAWQSSPGVGIRGIFPSDFRDPLPVIASSRFIESTGRKLGDAVEVSVAGVTVPVKIADTVDFFPTMDPSRPFVLGNMDTLLYYGNLFHASAQTYPNEVWISLSKDQGQREKFETWLRTTRFGPYAQKEGDFALRNLQSDPLVGSGSRGIVFTAFIVLVVVSIGGYLGYFYVSSFRTPLEFAVLRALGLTSRQLLALQVLVHGIVVASALALGAWIGLRAHAIMITFLQHTERGEAVVPPLAPRTDWMGLWVVLITSLALLGIVVGWLGWTFARVPIWRVLRKGEE